MLINSVNFISVSMMKIIRLLTAFFTGLLFMMSIATAQKLAGQAYYPTTRLKSEVLTYLKQFNPIQGQLKSSFTLPSDFPFVIDDINYQYSWTSSNIEVESDQNILVQLQNAQIHLNVPHLKIDSTIIKYIDGVVVKVKVKSECKDINLKATADVVSLKLARLDSTSNSPFDFALGAVDLEYKRPNLEIENFNCSNIQGLEAEIKENIFENFNQLDLYRGLFLQKLNEIVQTKIQDSLLGINQVIEDNFNQFQLNLNQKIRVKSVNSNLLVLQFGFNEDYQDDLENIPESISDDSFAILFNVKKNEFIKFMSDTIKMKLEKTQISSKQIKALDKLTKSRFQQFFVWPALMKRPKGKELILKPTIESLSVNVAQNVFSKSMKANITSGLWSYDSQEAMVYFRSQFTSNISFLSGTQASFPISGLKTSATWNEDYLKTKKCSKKIATKIIDSIGQSVFNQNWAKQNLNAIVFGQDKKYRFKDVFNKDNKTFFIRLENLK